VHNASAGLPRQQAGRGDRADDHALADGDDVRRADGDDVRRADADCDRHDAARRGADAEPTRNPRRSPPPRRGCYDHSEVLYSEVTVLNSASALYRAAFSRRRSDGGEMSRLTVTYLVTGGPVGRRISAPAVHGPDS
jgi:hypothetical protein